MPPRKNKKSTMEIKETPIIFFLKINENQDIICPVGEKVSYSDILSQTFIENTAEERFSNDILKPLLENIHKEKEYSRTTSCFWCCHGFNTTAFALPITYDTYKNTFICEGHYCSPECALAFLYNDYSISDSSRWYRHSLLIQLYGFLYEQYIISPAPPKTCRSIRRW